MYKKCENCYKDGKTPNEESCKKCEDDLKRKEQECEKLKKELHKNFEEKDTLHLIIDRLLEAGGYDTNTASAEDFEDVYEHMRYEQQQLDQLRIDNEDLKKIIERLDVPKHEVIDMDIAFENEKLKAENDELKGNYFTVIQQRNKAEQTLVEIKEMLQVIKETNKVYPLQNNLNKILQKISECEVENG